MNTFFNTLRAYVSSKKRGFVLPFTLILCVIMLTISSGISIVLIKQLYFSKVSRLSQVAYLAADAGIMCATIIDDQYTESATGLGIFPYNPLIDPQTSINATLADINAERQSQGYTSLTLLDIRCATSAIFDATAASFTVTPFTRTTLSNQMDTGYTSTFSMKMDMGDGTSRCATVSVNKTPSYRQIISRGYAACGLGVAHQIERAVVNTTETDGSVVDLSENNNQASSTQAVLTSGTSWTVPAGVTSIKVWAIGGGGGGAGAVNSDYNAGGGGGSGGVGVRTFSVSPGDVVSYSIGLGGSGGANAQSGYDGGQTTVTVSGVTMTARGGYRGQYNNNSIGAGGNATNADLAVEGGAGSAVSGDMGGGGGGGIGGSNGVTNGNAGGTGGQAADVSGLFAVLSAAGYPITSPGVGGGSDSENGNSKHGTNATGFGSGGGGSGWYGGNGGSGLYGGGGGGAAGYSAGQVGGAGGVGVVVISY